MSAPEKTVVLLYYTLDEFFKISSLESMYRTEFDLSKNGESNLDKRDLTETDRQLFLVLIKRASTETYQLLQAIKATEEGYLYDSNPVRTVAVLNALDDPEENLFFKMSDAGTLTPGNLAVVANDYVYFDGVSWLKDNVNFKKYVVFTLALPWNFDLNNKFGLDDKVKEYMTMHVLRNWFLRQRYDTSLLEAEFVALERDIRSIINYRVSNNRASRTF
jgi:hypothetical protein